VWDRSFSAFGGGGQQLGSTVLQLDSAGSKASSFQTQGFLLEGGFTIPWSRGFGTQLSAEYSLNNGPNTLNSPSFLEQSESTILGGKLGVFYGPITVGGGMQQMTIKIRTMSASGSYLESRYSSAIPMAFINMNFDFFKMFRGAVEAQYRTGKLAGTESTSGQTNVTEMMISIRAYILLGAR
jgi:hypothetical protein